MKKVFLLTSEHASPLIPAKYQKFFKGRERFLQTHRGWDPGTKDVADLLSRRFQLPHVAGKYSRLLVDLNRSTGNPEIYSPITQKFSEDQKKKLIQKYHQPHWERVDSWVQREIRQGHQVIHLAIHSFTPVRWGIKRTTDLGLLYDPRRFREKEFCKIWEKYLRGDYIVKHNYPYRGDGDGLPKNLREKFPAKSYLGLELEINQALVRKERSFEHLKKHLVQSLIPLIGE